MAGLSLQLQAYQPMKHHNEATHLFASFTPIRIPGGKTDVGNRLESKRLLQEHGPKSAQGAASANPSFPRRVDFSYRGTNDTPETLEQYVYLCRSLQNLHTRN